MPDPDEHDHQDDEQQQQQQDEQQDDTGARLDRLETTVGRIAAAVDRLLPGSRQDAQQRTEDRPTDIQAQVRAELERRDREAAEQQAAQTAEQEQRELRETVARLQEQPPAPPVPRRTRLLGWGE